MSLCMNNWITLFFQSRAANEEKEEKSNLFIRVLV